MESFSTGVDRYRTLMAANGLESLINEPTRVTEYSETCIDHVFVRIASKNTTVVDVSVVHAEITDHSMIRLSVQVLLGGDGRGVPEGTPPAPSPGLAEI